MKTKATIRVSRWYCANSGKQTIRITICGPKGLKIFEGEMALETFAEVVTGMMGEFTAAEKFTAKKPRPKARKTVKRKTLDGHTVDVEILSTKEQRGMSRDELKRRARVVSEGGSRPDGMSREEWRTSQGSFYDDDRC